MESKARINQFINYLNRHPANVLSLIIVYIMIKFKWIPPKLKSHMTSFMCVFGCLDMRVKKTKITLFPPPTESWCYSDEQYDLISIHHHIILVQSMYSDKWHSLEFRIYIHWNCSLLSSRSFKQKLECAVQACVYLSPNLYSHKRLLNSCCWCRRNP